MQKVLSFIAPFLIAVALLQAVTYRSVPVDFRTDLSLEPALTQLAYLSSETSTVIDDIEMLVSVMQKNIMSQYQALSLKYYYSTLDKDAGILDYVEALFNWLVQYVFRIIGAQYTIWSSSFEIGLAFIRLMYQELLFVNRLLVIFFGLIKPTVLYESPLA